MSTTEFTLLCIAVAGNFVNMMFLIVLVAKIDDLRDRR